MGMHQGLVGYAFLHAQSLIASGVASSVGNLSATIAEVADERVCDLLGGGVEVHQLHNLKQVCLSYTKRI